MAHPTGTSTESASTRDLFLEQFSVPTWQEHLRQHDGRLTAEDEAIEERAFGWVVGPPRAIHLLPASTPRSNPVAGERAESSPGPRLPAIPEADG